MNKENKSEQKTVQDEHSRKIRFKFSKVGAYKYFSHLDIISIISRAIRRAKIRVKYSEGFNPKPKISFGPPTSLGIESRAEYGDIILTEDLEPEDFLMRLNHALKDKIKIEEAIRIPSSVKSIMSQTDIIKYSICFGPGGMVQKGKDSDRVDSPERKVVQEGATNDLRSLLSNKNEQTLRGIYKLEEIKNDSINNQIVLNLYGYAKILKGIESKVFKFGEFKIFLEEIGKESSIENIKIIKEELYIIYGEKLITPFEIL